MWKQGFPRLQLAALNAVFYHNRCSLIYQNRGSQPDIVISASWLSESGCGRWEEAADSHSTPRWAGISPRGGETCLLSAEPHGNSRTFRVWRQGPNGLSFGRDWGVQATP